MFKSILPVCLHTVCKHRIKKISLSSNIDSLFIKQIHITIMKLDEILDDSAKKAFDIWTGKRKTRNHSTSLDDILDDSAKKAFDN